MAMGRPKVVVDWKIVEALCFAQCSRKEILEFLHISEDTLERSAKAQFNGTLAEFLDQKKLGGVASVRKKLFQQAMKGSSAAIIFFLKNYGGMADDPEKKPMDFGDIPLGNQSTEAHKPN